MSDSYQAIYDAVRSRIYGFDGHRLSDAIAQQFDISRLRDLAQQELYDVSYAFQRPSVLYRPRIFPDGSMWCALYGDNLQEGVAGFGESPAAAVAAFDQAWVAAMPVRRQAASEAGVAPDLEGEKT